MENTTKTVELQKLGQILSVGASLVTVEATTETATETTATETTATQIVATVEHREAVGEEVKEALIVRVPFDETKIEGELAEALAEAKSGEVNLNELFTTAISFRNGVFSINISARETTV